MAWKRDTGVGRFLNIYYLIEIWNIIKVLVTGMKWKHTRRLLTPAFHFKILDTFFDVFNRNSTVLTEIMAKKIEESNAGEMDMIPLMKRCTLDIICGELDLVPLTIVGNFQLDV